MKKDKNVKESDPRNDNSFQDKAPDSSPSTLKSDTEGEEILSEEEIETAKKINQAETERD